MSAPTTAPPVPKATLYERLMASLADLAPRSAPPPHWLPDGRRDITHVPDATLHGGDRATRRRVRLITVTAVHRLLPALMARPDARCSPQMRWLYRSVPSGLNSQQRVASATDKLLALCDECERPGEMFPAAYAYAAANLCENLLWCYRCMPHEPAAARQIGDAYAVLHWALRDASEPITVELLRELV